MDAIRIVEDHRSGKNVLTMPTEWGGFTHRYFRAPTTVEEQVAARDAIAAWARVTYGYVTSHAKDFATPDLRKYLDLYLRGSGGEDAVGRVKLMKLLWDAIGSECGGRHELYEINYSGSHEEIRRYALFGALALGQYDRWKQFAETCMAEYDLDGWKAKDLVDTGRISALR